MIEFNNDLLAGLTCDTCDVTTPLFASLGKVTEAQGRCPTCGSHRTPKVYHTIDGSETFLDRTLADVGVPRWDVVAGRQGMEQKFYEFAADAADVLGPLSPRS
jgi:adenylyltransferase/sulfurtransferase